MNFCNRYEYEDLVFQSIQLDIVEKLVLTNKYNMYV